MFEANSANTDGGGIACIDYASPTITNCVLTGNSARTAGGGVFCQRGSNPIIQSCQFLDNTGRQSGGAISCDGAAPVIGGGSGLGNYFAGNDSDNGADLAVSTPPGTPITATYNTFAGYCLSDFYVSPVSSFNLTNSTSNLTPVTQDVYVSVSGNDANDGLTWGSAFKTVRHALSVVAGSQQQPLTVHLGVGTFSALITGERYPLPLVSYVSLTGQGPDLTVLNSETTTTALRGFYDTALTISAVTITGSRGPGINVQNSSLTIDGCQISGFGNTANGGGLACVSSSPTVINTIFSNNTATTYGGAVYCRSSSNPFFQNSQFIGNYSGKYGGAVHCQTGSNPKFWSCTFTANTAVEIGGALCLDSPAPIIGGDPDFGNRFENNHAASGADLAARQNYNPPIVASYNSFSGYHLSDYYVSPVTAFTLTNCTSDSTPIIQDVYVAVDGDDANDGISWETAFLTLQHALSTIHATSANPLTVHVGPGTFASSTTGEQFPLPLMDYVSILGDSQTTTVLSGDNAPHLFFGVFDDSLTLSELKLERSTRSAVSLLNSLPSLANCTFENINSSTNGAGILCDASSPSVTNCTFRNLQTDRFGAGLYAGANSSPSLTGCVFETNYANSGGGGVLSGYAANSTITACTFTNNSTPDYGGAIFCFYGAATITQCEITDNVAIRAGGGIAIEAATPVIGGSSTAGNHFARNRSSVGSDLAALSLPANALNAQGNSFDGLHLSDYYVSPQAAFTLTDCSSLLEPISQDVFVSPLGDDANSGLTADDPFRTIQHALSKVYGSASNPVTIYLAEGTYSQATTGEIYPLPLVSYVSVVGFARAATILNAGGQIHGFMAAYDQELTIEALTLTGSTRAGLDFEHSSLAVMDCAFLNIISGSNGGGIACRTSTASIVDCWFSGNRSSSNGGGIFCADYSTATIARCTFENNQAGDDGGAIHSYFSTPFITECFLSGNVSKNGGGVYSRYDVDGLVAHCTIVENTARAGGGVSFINSSNCDVVNCLIARNVVVNPLEVDAWGAGIYVEASSVGISHSTIVENLADGFSRIYGGGVCAVRTANVSMIDAILWDNAAGKGAELWVGKRTASSSLSISYSDVEGLQAGAFIEPGSSLSWGAGLLNADPLFAVGPRGEFYLHQEAATRLVSPCVDSGSEQASTICLPVLDGYTCIDEGFTTAIDELTDVGILDLGFHYFGEPCLHTGDVTNDGQYSAGDAQLAFMIGLGLYNPSPVESCWADCNADGIVSASDAQTIFATALGQATCVDPMGRV